MKKLYLFSLVFFLTSYNALGSNIDDELNGEENLSIKPQTKSKQELQALYESEIKLRDQLRKDFSVLAAKNFETEVSPIENILSGYDDILFACIKRIEALEKELEKFKTEDLITKEN